MTYGRVCGAADWHDPTGAAVSHLAELVRGCLLLPRSSKAPHPALRATLSPRGEGPLPRHLKLHGHAAAALLRRALCLERT